MKKILIFISFLFAVVCYAAPPTDLLPDIAVSQAGFDVQDNVGFTGFISEAPEVAYNYIGDSYVYTDVSVATNNFLMLPDAAVTEGIIMKGSYLWGNYGYCPNNQHSNYSYPFGGNYDL